MQVEEIFTKELGDMSVGSKQVFIVDDDRSICRALKLLLMTYGFDVDTFSSAEEFFSAVPNSTPGCLILDIHMPGISGWEAQKRLEKSGSNRPVIFISADKREGLRDKAFKAGVAGFLQKPFHDQDLVDLINQAY